MKASTKSKKETKIKFNLNKKSFSIVVGIVSIILIAISIYLIIKNLEYKKYEHYEQKMNSYGFNNLYDNGSAKTSEKVTKSEAMKMVIGTCLNTFDIQGFAKQPTETYQNAIWVLYAQDANLTSATNLNKDTANKNATYVEVIEYFTTAKKKLLNKELLKETNKELKDINKYSSNEQTAILDMLSNNILKVIDNKLNGNKKIFKGQLNEIVINYIEKYDLFGDKIQTDELKFPSNASEYAYISEGVAKEVYEMPYKIDTMDSFVAPKECFTEIKPYYEQIIEKIEKYYNTLVNVDYQITTVENLKNSLNNLTLTDADDADLNAYIEYIKLNQIKITGNVKVQKPIIYYDGLNYKFRTKLEFKVENSLTTDNLLFGDLSSGNTIRYENKDNSIIVDVSIGSALNTETYYIKNSTLNILLGNDNEYKIYNTNYYNVFEDMIVEE